MVSHPFACLEFKRRVEETFLSRDAIDGKVLNVSHARICLLNWIPFAEGEPCLHPRGAGNFVIEQTVPVAALLLSRLVHVKLEVYLVVGRFYH